MEFDENKNKFIVALVDGDCGVVDFMLDSGFIPDENYINVPCEHGNVDVLTKPLSYPMNLQQGLFTAVEYGHIHLLNHLFAAGVNINSIDMYGNTALHKVQDKETCQWLLDMGIKQTPNNNGNTHSMYKKQCRIS